VEEESMTLIPANRMQFMNPEIAPLLFSTSDSFFINVVSTFINHTAVESENCFCSFTKNGCLSSQVQQSQTF
jgi:hypothetical protein